jgi:hypothetical protein
MQAQAQSQMMQQAFQGSPYQQMPGQWPNEHLCTCVPARHDMLLGALPVLRQEIGLAAEPRD